MSFTLPPFVRAIAVGTLLLGSTQIAQAQQVTQYGFTGVTVPQYLGAGNNSTSAGQVGPKLVVIFQATITFLQPTTLYRYYVLGSNFSNLGGTDDGKGDAIFITPGATTTYVLSTSPSLTSSSAGKYGTFTTDATGSYTGWFGFLNDNDALFTTAGSSILPLISYSPDGAPSTDEHRLLDIGITPLGFTTVSSGGTLLSGGSSATPAGNIVLTYDNVAGTGRPLSAALIESAGITTGTSKTGTNSFTYVTTAGSYNTIIPNNNANGVRRVEERSMVSGNVINCNTDADGHWPSSATAANSVNPAGAAHAPVILTRTDTPLNTGCATTAATTKPSNTILEVWPNPASDMLTVRLPGLMAGLPVQLHDLLGRTVRTTSLPASGEISLRGLPAGTYLLTVSGSTRRITKE